MLSNLKALFRQMMQLMGKHYRQKGGGGSSANRETSVGKQRVVHALEFLFPMEVNTNLKKNEFTLALKAADKGLGSNLHSKHPSCFPKWFESNFLMTL